MKTNILVPLLAPNKQESFWYDGQVATVEKDGRTFSIEATGVIRIFIDKKAEGEFDGCPRLDNEDAVKKAHDLGFEDDDLHDDDKIYWDNNNWFAIRELDENGDAHDDVEICHIYSDAIELAQELI
jgi:hypothetical protein